MAQKDVRQGRTDADADANADVNADADAERLTDVRFTQTDQKRHKNAKMTVNTAILGLINLSFYLCFFLSISQ